MKYIMFEFDMTGGTTYRWPVIFPNTLVHADVARAMRNSHPLLKKARIASAGDVSVSSVECSGRSETLKLTAHSDDDRIIENIDYMFGIDEETAGSA